MLIFGETSIKVDPLIILRDNAEKLLGKLIADGVIEMSKFPGLIKLISSTEKENIKLALNIMESYVEKFNETLVVRR